MRLQKILHRRKALLQQIAQQRAELQSLALPYQTSINTLDKVYGLTRHLGGTRVAVGAGVLSFLFLRKPGLAFKLASAAFTAVGAWMAFKKSRQG